MSDNLDSRDQISPSDELYAELLEEITARVEANEPVDVDAYIREYPQLSERIRAAVPAVEALQSIGLSSVFRKQRPSHEPQPLGEAVGDFRLVRELGRGGMGIVYQAEQTTVGRRVALKILPFAALLNQTQLERFNTEATAAARLHHPGIVQVYSVGCERGIHFYAMQLIDGPSLADVIAEMRNERHLGDNEETVDTVVARRAEVLTRDEDGGHHRAVARIGKEAAEALHYAHENGVLHRDIKPSNLLLDKKGHVWIADFGLARVEDESQLTRTGDILGTLRYMSPEQATGERVDARSDVYSLGATLYELVTLGPVYDAEDRRDIVKQVLAGNPIAPHKVDNRIPTPLSHVISKAMARLDERYQSADELAEDLQRFLDGEAVTAKSPTRLRRAKAWSRRHRVASAAIVGLLILVLLLPFTTHYFFGRATDSPTKGPDMNVSKTAKVAAAAAAIAMMAGKPAKPPTVSVPDPTGVVVSAATEDSITLEWISGGGTTAGFVVAYLEGTKYPRPNLRGATIIEDITTEYHTVPGLKTDQVYSFRVCAVDSKGNRSEGVTVQGTTVSGAVPAEFTLLGSAHDTVDRHGAHGRLIQQADGKLLSPGQAGERNLPEVAYVLRWNADGTVDYVFGNGGDGAFDHDFGGPIGADHATDVVEQKVVELVDGEEVEVVKLVVVGCSDGFTDAWIARLEQDGSFDPSFGNNGKVEFLFPNRNGTFGAVVVLPEDNSLLALGNAHDPPKSIMMVKFTSAGHIDTSFGDDGYSTIDLGEPIQGKSQIYVSSDGLLVAGSGPGFLSSVVYKINPNTGTLDPSFGGGDGIAEIAFDPDGSEAFYDLAIQEDGKIVVVGGASSTYDIFEIWNQDLFESFSIARFNADGSIDETFGDLGAKLLDFGPRGQFARVEVLSNGKIVAFGTGGTSFSDYWNPTDTTDLYLARFNSNGSSDLTFNGTGRIKFDLPDTAPLAEGMIVVDDYTYLISGSAWNDVIGWIPHLGMVWELP